jgi:site-specific DNA recombinase
VVGELAKRKWTNKLWTTKKGIEKGGRPFDKGTLYKTLTNRTYTGIVTHGDQVYAGEHAAIVKQDLFQKVHAILGRNGKTAGAVVKNKYTTGAGCRASR